MLAFELWWKGSSRQQERRAELEAEMGTGKKWECWWLMTNFKGKLMKETSLTEHLPHVGSALW